MLSMMNGMCGIDDVHPAERLDIQPFQGWGTGDDAYPGWRFAYPGLQDRTPLGFKIKAIPKPGDERPGAYPWPCRGRRRRINHLQFRNEIAFVKRPELVGWAPLMAGPFCG